jgi:diguanylate cyclase (GGDEF)-like protein
MEQSESNTESQRLQETLARLASFPELNPGPIVEVGLDGQVYYLNPKAARSLPDLQEEGLQHPFLEGLQSVAAALQNGEKGSLVREVQVGSVWYEQVMHYVDENKRIRVYARDISDRKRVEEALAEQAIRDTLTGLYNRRYFNHRILEEIAQAKRNQHTLAILMCDLDHFKAINEARGHHRGDEVLKAVAKSVQDSTRGTDLVFRWGGDEIVVALSDANREGGLIVAERIRAGAQKVNEEAGFHLDLSIGMAFCPEHGNTAPELIRVAERALHIAKKSEDKVHIGEQEYHLDEHSIKIVFQPIMNVRSQEVLGYEALGRDPQGKVGILELFKKYQAIGQLTELKSICVKAAIKAAQRVKLKRVFINTDFNLLSHLDALPKPDGLEVILEISELEALHEIENRLRIARKWREQGYKFAIDDFGAGFISLPFVAQLMPEYIKLDRSTMLQTVSSEQFKEFMIGLVFGLRNYASEGIIAEGIETEKELKIIKDVGIYLIQGFLFGKPQELK